MQNRVFLGFAFCLALPLCAEVRAQAPQASRDGFYFPETVGQTETDEYTRYELLAPETASFKIFYEVAATTAGAKFFYNPIRKGSSASDEGVYDAMLGTPLHFEVVSGAEMTASKINVGEAVAPTARVVVIPFAALKTGQTLRLRIAETYTAPLSYKLDNEELVFDRSLGRPRNAVVLPSGWYCTFSAAPATLSQLPDGRVRLDYWDDRPEAVDVLIKARRRVCGDEVRQ